jgi:hypothetical protein
MAKSSRRDMVKKYLNERGLRILEALSRVAKQYDVTTATVALSGGSGKLDRKVCFLSEALPG